MLHQWGWNLARRSGPLLRAKFHPHRCKDKGIGPTKLKLLLIFDQNVEYKRPAGAYPLCNFHKICRICSSFQDALAVNVSLNLLKGLWSYGHFNLTGSGYPQIFSAPSGKTMRQTPNVLEVQKRARGPLSPTLVWLGFHPPPGWRKIVEFFCRSVMLFCPSRFFCHACDVTLLNVRVCAPYFTMKTLEYRNDFDAVG